MITNGEELTEWAKWDVDSMHSESLNPVYLPHCVLQSVQKNQSSLSLLEQQTCLWFATGLFLPLHTKWGAVKEITHEPHSPLSLLFLTWFKSQKPVQGCFTTRALSIISAIWSFFIIYWQICFLRFLILFAYHVSPCWKSCQLISPQNSTA